MSYPILWAAFSAGILAVLALDLGVFHREAHAVRAREAAIWCAVWVTLAAAFGVGIALTVGREKSLEFATGYLVEEALSVDNLFVFLVLFGYFRVPEALRHRVLFWGILGALVLRGVMIAGGVALLHYFHWIIYVFGAFLVVTGVRMAFAGGDDVEPEHNPALKLVRRLVPVTRTFRGASFFARDRDPHGRVRWHATPLFVVLVLVETTDVVFAVDSIPAVFGVTRDPFIIYSSNVFAILGLRSLFFLLAGVIARFHLLRYGLAAVLVFVGAKMLASGWRSVPTGVSLAVIAVLLGGSVVASLLIPPPPEADPAQTGERLAVSEERRQAHVTEPTPASGKADAETELMPGRTRGIDDEVDAQQRHG